MYKYMQCWGYDECNNVYVLLSDNITLTVMIIFVQKLNVSMGYLVGDCLVAAAFLSYAGPFLSNYRDELVQLTWLKQVLLITSIIGTHCGLLQVRELSIPCTPDYTFANFLGNPATVREWNIWGLPSDAFSTENGVIVSKSNRFE